MRKPYRIFLSYSHEDEKTATNLKKHMATLITNHKVELWFDRELIAGGQLDEDIKRKLQTSDIFIFLVSSDFLDSYYCTEVEVKTALKRKKVKVIPLIARVCDWKESVLGSYTALPKDGKALSKHNDIDSAFNECIEELKKVITELDKTNLSATKGEYLGDQKHSLNEEFEKWLNSTDVVFQHREKDEVNLQDVYIFPDLEIKTDDETKGQRVVTSSSKLVENFNNCSESALILGSEQSGKTSLAKAYFNDLLKTQYLPLLIDCNTISSSKSLRKDISKACRKQYDNLEYDDYISSSSRKIAILDNFEKLSLNTKYAKVLIDQFIKKSDFDQVIIFADSAIRNEKDKMDIFDGFEVYMILHFGYEKREELICKWNSIGVIETISNEELERLNKASRIQVDAIIRKNVVPSKPFFILSILQLLETSRPSEFSLTSYGHCYQSLITEALRKANIAAPEFNTYINYLTQLANAIYRLGYTSIDEDQLRVFKANYSKNFLIGSHEKVLNKLLDTNLLKKKNRKVSFSYKYIFYFFAAKYIAENITHANSKKVLSDLCDRIHTEMHANILIFVTHHSKDTAIIDEILVHASMIFDGQKEAALSVEDFSHIQDVLNNLPKTIIEQKNVAEEKQKRLKIKDKFEKPVADDSDLLDEELVEQSDQSLAEINRSWRMVEVIGQILRNRHGDLSKSELKEFIESGFGSGLRFLDWWIKNNKKNEQSLIKIISDLLKESGYLNLERKSQRANIDSKIEKKAQRFYVYMHYVVSFAVLHKLCFSMGSENLISLFERVADENPESPSIQIINLAIQLEFGDGIPFKLLGQLKKQYQGNIIAEKLLQHFAVDHVYLNYVATEDKQRLSNILGIPMRYQRQLEKQSQAKLRKR